MVRNFLSFFVFSRLSLCFHHKNLNFLSNQGSKSDPTPSPNPRFIQNPQFNPTPLHKTPKFPQISRASLQLRLIRIKPHITLHLLHLPPLQNEISAEPIAPLEVIGNNEGQNLNPIVLNTEFVLTMAAPRSLVTDIGRQREEQKALEDSPTNKKSSVAKLSWRWELGAAIGVILLFGGGLFCIYSTMPATDKGKMKFPKTISDLRVLKDHLATYAEDHQAQFILGYCATYIFMQTFMIPGTIFMSLLAGALFGVFRGLFLVIFNATAGASSCYFLSKLFGRPLVNWLWPEKLRFFQAEISKRRDKLLNYMLFLRITPTLPNTFINVASPIVDIPFHVFFLATMVGLIPAAYITVRAGLALGDLKSVKDLYDFKTLAVLFLIGSVSIFPTILKRKRKYE